MIQKFWVVESRIIEKEDNSNQNQIKVRTMIDMIYLITMILKKIIKITRIKKITVQTKGKKNQK